MNVAAIKTYTNKSNAARAAKKANGGTLEGLDLKGKEGAWYYQARAKGATTAAPDSHTGDIVGQAAKVLHQAAVANETAAQMLEQAAPLVGAQAPAKAPGKGGKGGKAPAGKKGGKAAAELPTGKDVAGAYPSGVKGIKANQNKGKARERTKTGYKLEKERPEAHGVQRKSTGTVGAQLWALFDKLLAKLQAKDKKAGAKDLALSQVRGAGEEAGFNSTTVALAFYQWRRFNGVRGRGKKQKVDGNGN